MERNATGTDGSGSLYYFSVVVGVAALVLTWAHTPGYFFSGPDGALVNPVSATILFWKAAFVESNPAGKFLGIDVLMLAWCMNVWMVVEGRKRGIKWIWAYILGGVFVAISFTAPLFLAARERQLSRQGDVEVSDPSPRTGDWIGLALIGLVTLSAAIGAIVM